MPAVAVDPTDSAALSTSRKLPAAPVILNWLTPSIALLADPRLAEVAVPLRSLTVMPPAVWFSVPVVETLRVPPSTAFDSVTPPVPAVRLMLLPDVVPARTSDAFGFAPVTAVLPADKVSGPSLATVFPALEVMEPPAATDTVSPLTEPSWRSPGVASLAAAPANIGSAAMRLAAWDRSTLPPLLALAIDREPTRSGPFCPIELAVLSVRLPMPAPVRSITSPVLPSVTPFRVPSVRLPTFRLGSAPLSMNSTPPSVGSLLASTTERLLTGEMDSVPPGAVTALPPGAAKKET